MHLPIALSRKALLVGALMAGLAALLAALLVTQLGGPSQAGAADHRDAPGLTPPGGDVARISTMSMRSRRRTRTARRSSSP